MVNAQKWLDENYPKDQRSRIRVLDVGNKNLESELDLSDFIDLEELNCSHNQLTSLKLDNFRKLKKLICDHNRLVQLGLINLGYLKELICWDNYLQDLKLPSQTDQLINIAMGENNLPKQDLSMFSQFINLKHLGFCNNNQEKVNHGIYNRFYGSLEFLQNLTKLETLDIRNTDIDSGLEYLSSDNIRWFGCSANIKKDAKCKVICNLVASEDYEGFRKWKITNASLIQKAKRVDKLDQQLQQLSDFLFPNQPYDFTQLKQEIARLKYQELAPQARGKRAELEQSIANAKTKASGLEKMVDLLMETQKQIVQTTETSQKDKLNGKIEAYQNILEDNLTSEEIQNLLSKQAELQQLEKHLASLQINQEQVAQIQQGYSPKQ